MARAPRQRGQHRRRPALIPVDILDQDQRLLGVGNGILDLRRYALREGKPEDYITVGTPVAYEPEAQAPLWLKFVDQVTCGDGDLAAYLQRFFGYCLTGEVDDQQFYIWLGKSGGNGKDTFGNTIINVLGSDLGKEMAFSTISATKHKRSGSEASSDLMALRAVRFIKTTEPRRGQAVNEALVSR